MTFKLGSENMKAAAFKYQNANRGIITASNVGSLMVTSNDHKGLEVPLSALLDPSQTNIGTLKGLLKSISARLSRIINDPILEDAHIICVHKGLLEDENEIFYLKDAYLLVRYALTEQLRIREIINLRTEQKELQSQTESLMTPKQKKKALEERANNIQEQLKNLEKE